MKPNATGLKGVSLHKGRWRATIYSNGKSLHLGYFDTPEDAHAEYMRHKAVCMNEAADRKRQISELTQEVLKKHFSYDPDTGVFVSLVGVHKRPAGTVVGCIKKCGYSYISIGCKTYQAHRLAWLYMTGSWPDKHIDHINCVKSDNRFSNLREATRSENQFNRGLNKNNTSGYKGVSWDKRVEMWAAKICVNRKSIWVGYFDTAEKAFEARVAAADPLHGRFARHAKAERIKSTTSADASEYGGAGHG